MLFVDNGYIKKTQQNPKYMDKRQWNPNDEKHYSKSKREGGNRCSGREHFLPNMRNTFTEAFW